MLDKAAPDTSVRASGPLAGYRIVEFAGIGPGPFACMMLADMGAEVVTLDRVGAKKNLKGVAVRGRKVVELDLKDKAAIAQVLDLLSQADALIEGFRPGVMERLGLGPDVVLARNPKLVYGRMTGWGQEGPLAQAAGHDINYISVTGALASIGPISAAARFMSWSACSQHCWKRRNPARDRWSMPRCATVPRR
jgi:alpha-methylacyl-CoA racemase